MGRKSSSATGAYDNRSSFAKDGSDYRAIMPQFTDEAMAQNGELLALLCNIAERHAATPAQVSLAWMMCKKPWIVPIPGMRDPSRLKENLGAAEVSLGLEEVAEIDAALDAMDMSPVFGGSNLKGTSAPAHP